MLPSVASPPSVSVAAPPDDSPDTPDGESSPRRTTNTRTSACLWRPFWMGILDHFGEFLLLIDTRDVWRRHVIRSKPVANNRLRKVLTERFSSSTIFLSLILASEIGVLTSPAKPADNMRLALTANEYQTLDFWTGVFLCSSILISIGAVVANLTAWSIFIAVSDNNLKTISLSSIGIYSLQLPNRLIICALYLFILWVCLFWFLIAPQYAAIVLTTVIGIAIVFVVSTYSALGNLIMNSGALKETRILDVAKEDDQSPEQLTNQLRRMKQQNQTSGVTCSELYKKSTPVTNRKPSMNGLSSRTRDMFASFEESVVLDEPAKMKQMLAGNDSFLVNTDN